MKLRRVLSVVVVTILAVTLLAGAAMASGGRGNEKEKGKGKGQINNIKVQVQVDVKQKKGRFSDVSEKHWGNKRIRAMVLQGIINGYGNGLFCPNASVSNIEAITMIMRMGDFDKEDLREAAKDQDVPRSVPKWAKEYAALAVEEDILTKDELKHFQPTKAAKRYQVAIWLGRYLDVDSKDADEDDVDFRDEKSIPDEALEYLPYLVERGYMTGYRDGKFMPNKPVTRAEMAVILSKVTDDKARDEDDIEVEIIDQFKCKGKINRLSDDELVIKTKSGSKREFSVDSEDIIVFLNNKEADYDDLDEGFTALVLCNSDDEALVIYAHSQDNDNKHKDDVDEVEGIFQKIKGDQIRIKVDDEIEKYDLADDVDVEIDNDNADLDDLLPGMEVELVIEDDEVTEIRAESLDEISGEFIDLDGNEIIVEVNGEKYTYTIARNIDVEIDDEDKDLEDLEPGMDVELTFNDKGKVIKIEAED